MSANQPERPLAGATMEPMPPTPAHAKPVPKRDHLWVLVVIAACCLLKVWPSWIGIGAEAGFPVIGGPNGMPTDWTLAVVIEAYWGYAIYAALAAPAGRRSRRYAAWSAAGVFVLSLAGQSAAEVVTPVAVEVFANALPVTVLALIAVLVHLRQKDREEAAEAGERTVVQAEMDALRERTETLAGDLKTERSARTDAERRAETAERKLAARKPNRTRTRKPNSGSRTKANSGDEAPANSALPKDFNARTKALELWLANPDISGRELGEECGRGERWGQLRKNEFATAAPKGSDPEE